MCSSTERMLASADSDAAPHPADCAPAPRRPVALPQGHSHRTSAALQAEVEPALAPAAGSGAVPSRVGSSPPDNGQHILFMAREYRHLSSFPSFAIPYMDKERAIANSV